MSTARWWRRHGGMLKSAPTRAPRLTRITRLVTHYSQG
uniref:Uncharacterized protein n=1 Tax=Arundo donax TaxID=35708 RepID=A0A0A9BEV0_ARUDO